MNIEAGNTLKMKKPHPCGCDSFLVLRSGMEFKLKCMECGHEFWIVRSKAEKNIKSIIKDN